MSTGYEGVCIEDFDRYFSGGVAWGYEPKTGEVKGWEIGSLRMEEDDPDGDNYAALAEEFNCKLYGQDYNTDTKWVAVSDLFHSREWVIHRFPALYITTEGGTQLHAISLEPRGRRMHKSMNFANMIRCEGVTALRLPENYELSSVINRNAARRGLAKVLSYGHHSLFPLAEKWKYDSTEDITALFDEDSTVKVVVPESHTAFLLSDQDSKVYILRSGDIIGHVIKDDEGLVVESSHPSIYPEGVERRLIKEGLTVMLERLIKGVRIRWTEE
jgi:hypothetical protein